MTSCMQPLSAQVGEIVDRAQKEEKMEQSLAKLKDTWSRVEFQFIKFKDTPISTVKLAEEDFEALEDNQVGHGAVAHGGAGEIMMFLLVEQVQVGARFPFSAKQTWEGGTMDYPF